MKITTRITLALALVTGLTVAALAYQLSVVEKLQGINKELSLNKLEAGRISLRLLQRVDGVQEFVAKALILGDPDYIVQWGEWEDAVEEDLVLLGALELSAPEEEERLRMEASWHSYREMVAPLRERASTRPDPLAAPAPPSGDSSRISGTSGTSATPATSTNPTAPVTAAPPPQSSASAPPLDEIDILLEDVRASLGTLMGLTDAAVAAHVRTSAEAGNRAQLVSRIATGSTILLASLICILLYLSISGPLRKLTGGTRELSRGNFDHRLEVRGEDELSDLARSFNRMARRLNELEEMKRDFVSHVSHELKGPLAAIHETILVLLDEIPGPVNEKQAHFLRLSHQSSERLSGMISNLLEISALEAGGVSYQVLPHDLDEVARSVLDEYAPVARERKIELSFTSAAESGTLLCDEDRIREVVSNLVGNAIKFSPPESRIRLTLREMDRLPPGVPPRRAQHLRAEPGPFLLLSVEDEGVGISDPHKEGVFEKFHQVKVEGRIHGQGVGLGLSISRRNVEAHAGAIWVEDAPKQGTIFQTLLPRVPSRWKEKAPLGNGNAAAVPDPDASRPADPVAADLSVSPATPVSTTPVSPASPASMLSPASTTDGKAQGGSRTS